jgi:hypothetical protein
MKWESTWWPNFKVLYQHLTGVTDENHEESQYSWSLGSHLNPGPPEYEVGVLTTLLQCCVLIHFLTNWLYIKIWG